MRRGTPEFESMRVMVISEVLTATVADGEQALQFNKKPERRRIARIAIEAAIDEWQPSYGNMATADVKRDLTAKVRKRIKKDLRSRSDELGFVMIITMSMIFTWILQAIVVTAVAALVNWWVTKRLERSSILQDLSTK